MAGTVSLLILSQWVTTKPPLNVSDRIHTGCSVNELLCQNLLSRRLSKNNSRPEDATVTKVVHPGFLSISHFSNLFKDVLSCLTEHVQCVHVLLYLTEYFQRVQTRVQRKRNLKYCVIKLPKLDVVMMNKYHEYSLDYSVMQSILWNIHTRTFSSLYTLISVLESPIIL